MLQKICARGELCSSCWDYDGSAQNLIAETMKLIGNFSYGSLIMDKEWHQDTLYTEGWGAAQMNINDPRFKKCTIITDNLYKMEMAKTRVCFDFHIQLGYHILQLVMLRMLQFRYDCLEEYCDLNNFKYLEMDTNSAYPSLASKWQMKQETTAPLQEDGTVPWFRVHIRGWILSLRMLQ